MRLSGLVACLAVPLAAAVVLASSAGAQTGLVAPPPLPTPAPLSVVPPPLPPQVQYFYNDNGKPAGPVTLTELGAKVAAGAIKADTLVWQAGTPNWVAAKELPAVAALLSAPATATGLPLPAGSVGLDVATYFQGTWESEGEGPAGSTGPAKLTLTFTRGGALTGAYAVNVGAANSAAFPVSGTWNAVKIDDKRVNLGLNLLILVNGQQRPDNSSSLLEIVDQNTLRDVADGSVTRRIRP